MSDFFARMGEMALGMRSSLVPAVTPLYGDDGGSRADAGFFEEVVEQRTDLRPQTRNAASVPDSARVTLPPTRQAPETGSPSPQRHAREDLQQPVLHAGSLISPAEPPRVSPPGELREGLTPTQPRATDRDASPDESPSPEVKRPPSMSANAERRAVLEPIRRAEVREDTRPELSRPRIEQPLQPSGLDTVLARLAELGTHTHASPASPPPTIVRISIGRIEVRAAPTPSAVTTQYRERKEPQGPSLAAFLAKQPAAS